MPEHHQMSITQAEQRLAMVDAEIGRREQLQTKITRSLTAAEAQIVEFQRDEKRLKNLLNIHTNVRGQSKSSTDVIAIKKQLGQLRRQMNPLVENYNQNLEAQQANDQLLEAFRDESEDLSSAISEYHKAEGKNIRAERQHYRSNQHGLTDAAAHTNQQQESAANDSKNTARQVIVIGQHRKPG